MTIRNLDLLDSYNSEKTVEKEKEREFGTKVEAVNFVVSNRLALNHTHTRQT